MIRLSSFGFWINESSKFRKLGFTRKTSPQIILSTGHGVVHLLSSTRGRYQEANDFVKGERERKLNGNGEGFEERDGIPGRRAAPRP